jgi:hypothetical protein
MMTDARRNLIFQRASPHSWAAIMEAQPLNPSVRTALSKLKSHHSDAAVKDMRAAFAADPGRARALYRQALMTSGWIFQMRGQ